MNNSLSSIRTALSTHLSAVTQLKQVKMGRDNDFSSGFPAVCYYLDGVGSEAVDNAPSDYRTYRFKVELYQQFTTLTVSDAETAFGDAVDAVLDKLNAKWQVPSGSTPTVDNTVIGVSDVQLVEVNSGPCLFVGIVLECKTLIY